MAPFDFRKNKSMSSPDTLQIPTDLLPRDGRFGSGPSKIRSEQITALVADAPTYLGTSHRQPAVRADRVLQPADDRLEIRRGGVSGAGQGAL